MNTHKHLSQLIELAIDHDIPTTSLSPTRTSTRRQARLQTTGSSIGTIAVSWISCRPSPALLGGFIASCCGCCSSTRTGRNHRRPKRQAQARLRVPHHFGFGSMLPRIGSIDRECFHLVSCCVSGRAARTPHKPRESRQSQRGQSAQRDGEARGRVERVPISVHVNLGEWQRQSQVGDTGQCYATVVAWHRTEA